MPIADPTSPPPPGLLSANIRGLGVGLATGMAYSAAKFSALKIFSSSKSTNPPTLIQIQETQSLVCKFHFFSPWDPSTPPRYSYTAPKITSPKPREYSNSHTDQHWNPTHPSYSPGEQLQLHFHSIIIHITQSTFTLPATPILQTHLS